MNRLFHSVSRCVLLAGLVILFSGCVESDTSEQEANKTGAVTPGCCCDVPSTSSLIPETAQCDKNLTSAVDAAFADLLKDETLAAEEKAAFAGEKGKELRSLVLARLCTAAKQCPENKEQPVSETPAATIETVKTIDLAQPARKALNTHLATALEKYDVDCCTRETLLVQVDQLFTPAPVSVTPAAPANQ
jgi:hypothetical protein